VLTVVAQSIESGTDAIAVSAPPMAKDVEHVSIEYQIVVARDKSYISRPKQSNSLDTLTEVRP